MSRQRIAPALKPLESRFSPDTNYLHIPFHETSGNSVQVEYQLDGTKTVSTKTLSGSAPGTIWTGKPGWFTGDGTTYLKLDDVADIVEVMNPYNYRNGGILLMAAVWLKAGRTPQSSETHRVISFNTTAADGGYSFYVNNNANANVGIVHRIPNAASSDSKSLSISANEDVLIPAFIYLNYANRAENRISKTGIYNSSSVFTISSGDPVDGLTPGNGAVALARYTGSSYSDILNHGGNVTYRVHDLWAVGFKSAPTDAELAAVTDNWASRNCYEKLVELP